MDKYHIPRHLDEPVKIILWTMDEFFIFIIPFITLLLWFNQPIIAIVLGVMFVAFLKRLKGEQGHYFIYNLMYWYLPDMIKFKKTPPSYIRQLIG
jgi:type IV conjugative transfer system protein TraL